MITGYPITSLITGLLYQLGFHPNYPFAHLNKTSLIATNHNTFSIKKILDFFLNPISEEMSHVIITWPTMLFFCAFLIVICNIIYKIYKHFKKEKLVDECESFLYFLTIILFVLTIYSITALRMPDGNYFMILYAVVYLSLLFVLKNLSISIKTFTPLIIFCGGMCLLSNWAWTVGLTPINLSRFGYYNHYEENKKEIQKLGITNICSYIKKQNKNKVTRTMIYEQYSTAELLYIPGIVDEYRKDLITYGNAEILNSSESLCVYFDTISLDYFVFNKKQIERDNIFKTRMTELSKIGKLHLILEEGDNLLLSYNEIPKENDTKLINIFNAF